jgi:hypothetical protein
MTPDRDDNLDLLLRRADQAAGAPLAIAGLAGRVRERHTRRAVRRRRLTGVVTTACLAAGFGVLLSPFSKRSPQHLSSPPSSAVNVVAIRAEVTQIGRDADLRLASIDRATQNVKSRRGSASAKDPLEEIRWQREQAALVLVHQGDRLSRDLKLASTAAVSYRQARDAFAGTRGASVAESRLAGND